MSSYSMRYDAALVMAARAHQDQRRKGSGIPYITHVVHVSTILLRHGFNEDVVIAGLLHDVIEDCDISAAEIEAAFGAEIARLVVAVSEPKGNVSWEAAKAHKIEQLATGGPNVAGLKAADALHNSRSIVNDLHQDGPVVWQRFKRGPAQTLWYYRAILEGVRPWLGKHPLCAELAESVEELALLVEA
jgi:(p)ppGpp synthase/HD superfamily hydrolase